MNRQIRNPVVRLLPPPTRTIGTVVGVCVAVVAILMGLWVALFDFDPAARPEDLKHHRVEGKCVNTATALFSDVLDGLRVVLLVVGSVLAFRVRKLPTNFSESRWVLLTISTDEHARTQHTTPAHHITHDIPSRVVVPIEHVDNDWPCPVNRPLPRCCSSSVFVSCPLNCPCLVCVRVCLSCARVVVQ
jgi:hypothetical protein